MFVSTHSLNSSDLMRSSFASSIPKVWAERKKSDDVFSAYRREYKKRFAHIAAGKLTQEQFLQWAAEARKEKLKCAAGKISMEMYLDWLKNSK